MISSIQNHHTLPDQPRLDPMLKDHRQPLWRRDAHILLGGISVTILVVLYIWWPLAEQVLSYIDWNGRWWLSVDWLLLGLFLFMFITIGARASLKTDGLSVIIGLGGGLAIEAWGTQSSLWQYYTAERPPLWIIPAWPIATLSIGRMSQLLDELIGKVAKRYGCRTQAGYGTLAFKILYWITFASFLTIMVMFVSPTFEKPYTWLATMLCTLIIVTPTDHRFAILTFVAGTGLGYFLERWGTTRQCWMYYTMETPPLFAVLAHGMAAVAFWRVRVLVRTCRRISLS